MFQSAVCLTGHLIGQCRSRDQNTVFWLAAQSAVCLTVHLRSEHESKMMWSLSCHLYCRLSPKQDLACYYVKQKIYFSVILPSMGKILLLYIFSFLRDDFKIKTVCLMKLVLKVGGGSKLYFTIEDLYSKNKNTHIFNQIPPLENLVWLIFLKWIT